MQGSSVAARWAELDSCLASLVSATNSLRQYCHPEGNNSNANKDSLEAHNAQRTVVDTLARLQTLVAEPGDLLSQLAMQNQILACLHWLGEFQILAFIPRNGSITVQDIADLAAVPEPQLRRIVRMTAAVGFLNEPRPGYLEHTALSAPFGNRPSYHDALIFLTNTAAPAAMQMVNVTHQFRQQQLLQETSFNDMPFAANFEQQAEPRRQWPSYLRYALRDQDSSIESILKSFDWGSLGDATVVDVGARSTVMASALVEYYPSLKVVVQMEAPTATPEPNSRIQVQARSWAMPQTVRGAAVYALRVPYDFPTVFAQTRPARLRAELEAHLAVLRDSGSSASRLILTAPLLPKAGATADGIEEDALRPNLETAQGQVLDMALLQLANDRELAMGELKELVCSVGDANGRLVLEGELQPQSASKDGAFEIRYRRGMR